jgi:hypothetical protein
MGLEGGDPLRKEEKNDKWGIMKIKNKIEFKN